MKGKSEFIRENKSKRSKNKAEKGVRGVNFGILEGEKLSWGWGIFFGSICTGM